MITCIRKWAALLAAIAGLGTAVAPGFAQPVRDGHVLAELVSQDSAIVAGQPLRLGIRLTADPEWHTYWRNSGDSGLPTKIDWTLPQGFEAGSIQWPTPVRMPLATIMNYGYEGEVLLPVAIRTAAIADKQATVRAKVDWLVCSAEQCIPGTATLNLTLPVSSTASPDPATAGLFRAADERMPRESAKWQFWSQAENDGYRVFAKPLDGRPLPDKTYFFPDDGTVIATMFEQAPAAKDGTLSVFLKPSLYSQGVPKAIDGVWVTDAAQGWGDGISAMRVNTQLGGAPAGSTSGAAQASADTSIGALAGIMLAAFLGGMILNLMPCVFPVISLKILGFVKHAGEDKRKIALHGWMYAAGVLASFWVLAGTLLALRAAGGQFAWGFQMQSPVVVGGLCLLLLALALNMLGLFEMGTGLVGAAGKVKSRDGVVGSFMSGVLATVLATPCTAPFMGTALAFALTQSPFVALLVFTALAAGLAAPYVVLSLRPDWLKVLPRPGAWMDATKQAMAFPLLGTIIWLLWVFGRQTGIDGVLYALIGLLLLAIALWSWGRWGTPYSSPRARVVAAIVALLLIPAAFYSAWIGSTLLAPSTALVADAKPTPGKWQPFSPERLAALQADGKHVFVDFNAAWCATCIVNRKMVLDRPDVMAAFKRGDVYLLEADWTRFDPEITKILATFGRSGVPLHVLYAPGAQTPALVKDLVTTNDILGALAKLPANPASPT